MLSLIFGQFAAKLENKIRFRPRSVGPNMAGQLDQISLIHSFKEVADASLIRLTPVRLFSL